MNYELELRSESFRAKAIASAGVRVRRFQRDGLRARARVWVTHRNDLLLEPGESSWLTCPYA